MLTDKAKKLSTKNTDKKFFKEETNVEQNKSSEDNLSLPIFTLYDQSVKPLNAKLAKKKITPGLKTI